MELKPLAGRPKVGQKVILLRQVRSPGSGPTVRWERGTVEVVRRGGSVLVRMGTFEREVPWGDLRLPPQGGTGGPIWKRMRRDRGV
jgi:hypothetical protein